MIQRLPTKAVKGAAAFSKSISILQLIADSAEPPTTAKLVERTGMPRPTLHRILKALAAEEMVEVRADKTFILGARMIQLSGRALKQNDLIKTSEPELDWLCGQTQESIHLGIRAGQELIYLLKKDSPHAVRIASAVGDRVPFHASALGKAYLAFLPEADRELIISSIEMPRLTKYTITTEAELRAELDQVRRDGYAVSHQQSDVEIECYATCVFDRHGKALAGISVSVPLYRLNPDKTVYLRPLIACRDRIITKLGGNPNPKNL